MIREGLFSLEQRTKACFMSFRVSIDSGDNTLSCNLGKCECVLSSCDWIWTQDLQITVLWFYESHFTTAKNQCWCILPVSGWFVVGRIKKEFKIVLFLSVIGNRDVWCVACLFAKLVFFWVSPSSSIVTWLSSSMDQMKLIP
jgi:hypothetical protein